MAENRVIGRNGSLPWHYPEDLKFFKKLTLGHPILMGRSTYKSIGKPLPGRQNIVISRTLPETPGLTILRDAHQWREVVAGEAQAFLIGGARLFETLLPECSELYLTLVKDEVEGDVFMPPFEADFELAEILATSSALEFRRYVRGKAQGPRKE